MKLTGFVPCLDDASDATRTTTTLTLAHQIPQHAHFEVQLLIAQQATLQYTIYQSSSSSLCQADDRAEECLPPT